MNFIESELFTAVLSEGGQEVYRAVFDNGLTSRYFTDGGAKVLDYIVDYHDNNGTFPSIDLVRTAVPEFQPVQVKDNISAIIFGIKKNKATDIFYGDLKQTLTMLEKTGDVERALAFLRGKIDDTTTAGRDEVYDLLEGDKLYQAYLERYNSRLKETRIGIPSGFGDELDDYFSGGYQGGNLYGWLAPLGVGKSWSMTIGAKKAFRTGKRVLMVMLEGTYEKEGYRVMSGFNNISNGLLHSGMIDPEEFKRTIEEQRTFSHQSGGKLFLALHGNRYEYTPSDLFDTIKRTKPDIVFVDYPGLMGDGSGKNDWQVQAMISRKLKNFATSQNIPIIASLQSNRAAHRKDVIEADDATWYAVLRDFDVVMSISKPKQLEYFIMLNTTKGRDQKGKYRAIYHTNFDQAAVKFKEHVSDDGHDDTF